MEPYADLADAISGLFDGQVSVAVTNPRAAQPDVMQDEVAAVVNAVPARKLEFAAGRAAARRAMMAIGIAPRAIPAGLDRAPIWPTAVVGSISHSDKICVAVVTGAKHLRSVGVDIESASPLETDLIPAICSEMEQSRIAGPEYARLAKLVFSAKEATYKAQYPITGLLFDFDHLDVELNVSAGTFTATFIKPAAPFKVGDTLLGRFVQAAGHLVTGVMIGQDAQKGA